MSVLCIYTLRHPLFSDTAFASLRHSSLPRLLLTHQYWLASLLLMAPTALTVPRDVRTSASRYPPHFTRCSLRRTSNCCSRRFTHGTRPSPSLLASISTHYQKPLRHISKPFTNLTFEPKSAPPAATPSLPPFHTHSSFTTFTHTPLRTADASAWTAI